MRSILGLLGASGLTVVNVVFAASILAWSPGAEARNFDCGSVIAFRSFMSWTDFLHKPQHNADVTTWTYSHGNEWTLPQRAPYKHWKQRCTTDANGHLVSEVISWHDGGLTLTPTENHDGVLLPGDAHANTPAHAGYVQRFTFVPLGGTYYQIRTQTGYAGNATQFLHRRNTWDRGSQMVVSWHDGGAIGSRWEVICIRNCK